MVEAAPLEFAGTERFTVRRRIGAGAMGVVYEAFDQERGAAVALKFLSRVTANRLLYFKNEFRALQGIRHPNLVRLDELFEKDGLWFFTMELVDGVSLTRWVRPEDERGEHPSLPPGHTPVESLPTSDPKFKLDLAILGTAAEAKTDTPTRPRRPNETPTLTAVSEDAPTDALAGARAKLAARFDEARLREAFAQLAAGLDALHRSGRVHRDIKPSNVLVTPEGRVVILDFGVVAQVVDGHTRTDLEVAGTVPYMAPEQVTGENVGPAVDWYAFGTVLYLALTGHLPFRGSEREILLEKRRRTPARPSTRLAGVPNDLDLLCVRLLSPTPGLRPRAEEILETLRPAGQAPSGRAPSGSQDTLEAPRGSGVFVGRQEELAWLAAALEESRAGRTVLCFVRGESGVGKSALVERFLELAKRDGGELLVLRGRCFERESVPFKGVDGLVDDLSRFLVGRPKEEVAALLPRFTALLGRLFPVLRRVEAVAEAPTVRHQVSDPQALRQRMFGAFRELFARLSDRVPIVLYVDDFQWSDSDSLHLLAELTHPPESPPLLLVAPVRTDASGAGSALAGPETPGAASEANSAPTGGTGGAEATGAADGIWRRLEGDVRFLDLSPLTPEAAEALASRLLSTAVPDGPALARRASEIAREAEGHPLFIQELARYLEARPLEAGGLPLEEALWARIQELEAGPRALLDLLAAAEAPLHLDALAQAAEREFADITEDVEALRASHLARTTGARRSDHIELFHAAIRRAVAQHIPAGRVRSLHRSLVRALRQSGVDREDPQRLIRHLEAAGELAEAAECAIQAADHAGRALAFDQAGKLYRAALALGEWDDETRRRLHQQLGDVLGFAGRSFEAAEAYRVAAVGADPMTSLHCRRRAAEELLRGGHYDVGLAALMEVLRSVGLRYARSPKGALVSLGLRRARLALRGLGFRERPLDAVSPQRLTQIDVCWSAACGLSLMDPVRGADFQTRHLLLALAAGEPRRIGEGLTMEAVLTASAGVSANRRTARLHAEAERLITTQQRPEAFARLGVSRGVSAYFVGDFRRARAELESGLETLQERCTGVRWEIDSAMMMLVWAYAYLGALPELLRSTDRWRRQAEDLGDALLATNLRIGLAGMAELVRDDPRASRASIGRATEQVTRQGYHLQHSDVLLALAQTDLYEGDGRGVHARLAETWPEIKRSLVMHVEITRLELWQLQGRAALLTATTAEGKERAGLLKAAERAARRIEGAKAPWALPWAVLLRAAVAHLRGQTTTACELLGAAAKSLAEGSLGLYAAAAEHALVTLQGGADGEARRARIETTLRDEGAVAPARLLAMLAPGFALPPT